MKENNDMGLTDLFKKKNTPPAIQETDSGLEFRGIPVIVEFDLKAGIAHVREDFSVLEKEGIDKIILEKFVPWLKGDQFADRDDRTVFDQIALFSISYHYGRIIEKYSPTGKDDYFGQFEFDFESCGEYTEDMLEAAAMQVYVRDGAVVKVSGYDI